jgi:hypothetical protein
MTDRLALVSLGAIASAMVAWRWLWRFWSHVITGWGEYSPMFGSLDPAMLLLWALLLALWITLGALLVVIGRPSRPLLVSALVGASFALITALGSHNYIAPQATWATYAWAYGLYSMPPMGALIGAVVVHGSARRLLAGQRRGSS